MEKHAYLIMAHTNLEQLNFLLQCIDHEDNDIYIHLDIKMGNVDLHRLSSCCKKANVYFTDRINVVWGSVSQIKCELLLIEKACSVQKYNYLHLLSGQDVPIKSQEYIHSFFNAHNGKEFVHFECADLEGANYEKAAYYYPLQDLIGGKRNALYYCQRALVRLQRFFGVNRISNMNQKFAKGANWFSITGDFAAYVVENKEWVLSVFKNTLCCDEIFLQTLLINSEFARNIYYSGFDDNYEGNMRYIEWVQGTSNPRILSDLDLNKLLASDKLFARKFQKPLSRKSIEELYKRS